MRNPGPKPDMGWKLYSRSATIKSRASAPLGRNQFSNDREPRQWSCRPRATAWLANVKTTESLVGVKRDIPLESPILNLSLFFPFACVPTALFRSGFRQPEKVMLAVGRHGDTVAPILHERRGVGGSPRTAQAGGGFDGPADVLAGPGHEDCRDDGEQLRRDSANRQGAYLRGLAYCRSASNQVRTPFKLGKKQSLWFNWAGVPGSTTLTQQAPRLVKLW